MFPLFFLKLCRPVNNKYDGWNPQELVDSLLVYTILKHFFVNCIEHHSIVSDDAIGDKPCRMGADTIVYFLAARMAFRKFISLIKFNVRTFKNFVVLEQCATRQFATLPLEVINGIF